VSTTGELPERNSSGSSIGIQCADHGHLVGIVRSQTKTTEFVWFLFCLFVMTTEVREQLCTVNWKCMKTVLAKKFQAL
jgi:hypothetical protein